MPLAVVLIFPEPKTISWFDRKIGDLGSVDIQSDERLIIEVGPAHIFIDVGQEGLFFEEEDLQNIRRKIPNPFFCTLEFNDQELAEKAIALLADERDLLIDNGHGWVAPVQEVVRNMKTSRNWIYWESPGRVSDGLREFVKEE